MTDGAIPEFLPILFPCSARLCDGTVNGEPVAVVTLDYVGLLMRNFPAINMSAAEKEMLCTLPRLVVASHEGAEAKVRDIAQALTREDHDYKRSDEIEKDPLLFVQKQINDRVKASIVLWRERSSGNLKVGIHCAEILNAAYVQALFRIVGKKNVAGYCVVCGATLPRKRAERRKTCSARCRKALSRKRAATRSSHRGKRQHVAAPR